MRFTFSAVKAPTATQISIGERQQALPGDRVTGYGMCFRFDLYIPS